MRAASLVFELSVCSGAKRCDCEFMLSLIDTHSGSNNIRFPVWGRLKYCGLGIERGGNNFLYETFSRHSINQNSFFLEL